MALTTVEAFNEFHAKIALTSTQQQRVASRVARTREFLQEHFPATYDIPLRDATLMGSAQRGTAIRPLDDIDILAVFNNKDDIFEQYRKNSQQFLYRLRQRINANTTVRQVGARGQAVRLFYTDGLHVDIAPVFAWSGGGYALPSGTGGWITTDPPKQAQWATDREAALGGQFRRRARLAKRWNRVHSARLQSWHVEVIVGTAFGTMSANNRIGLMKFFEWAPNYLHVQDPDGHGGDLGASLTLAQDLAIRDSLNSNHSRAVNAVNAENRGDHAEAIRLWRIILGDEFPAYG